MTKLLIFKIKSKINEWDLVTHQTLVVHNFFTISKNSSLSNLKTNFFFTQKNLIETVK